MYNKLKKIVNEINGKEIKELEFGDLCKVKNSNILMKYVDTITFQHYKGGKFYNDAQFSLDKCEEENFFAKEDIINYGKDIDLQDLFLAFDKKNIDYILSSHGYLQINTNGWKEVCKFDMPKPLSNQKQEVYNKLISILK